MKEQSVEFVLASLKERAKELNCLYQVEELFSKPSITMEDIYKGIIRAIPPGWQFPDVCRAKLTIGGVEYKLEQFRESAFELTAKIKASGEVFGTIHVYYLEERPSADEGPFLEEERKLINTIAERLGRRIFHEKLRNVFEQQKSQQKQEGDWWVIIDLLRRTDPKLMARISRKMLNYLCWNGVKDAELLLEKLSPNYKSEESELLKDVNQPFQRRGVKDFLALNRQIFKIAENHLSENEIVSNIQKWIQEDRTGFLVNILENPASSLEEIAAAIERFHHLTPQGIELTTPREIGFRVSLVRRFLSDQSQYINIAKRYIEVEDFLDLLNRIVYPAGSHGKLGGKSAGLILAAQILNKSAQDHEVLSRIKVPRTWYLTSDGILNFMQYNNLEEVVEQKYKEIGRVRQEYPYVIHVFKNSQFPPEIIRGLTLALDDMDDVPLIVRSSSLLEDRIGTAFAGKYKSLFIANQGTKKERLIALLDAIAEVYASTFGPDPIKYRMERGLVDFHEEMGILIQEVVGTRVGKYYVPAFAGVAFSKNEFRWSPRIKREDGLIRIVPGLGTRAVDRLADDYPILVAPGQPGLNINVTVEEKIRYSPKKIDVINLETRTFETIDIHELFKEYGYDFPMINQLISIVREDHIQRPVGLSFDTDTDSPVVTFDGLFNNTPFLTQMHVILEELQRTMENPVDIEFAFDGKDFYLLQCRYQSYERDNAPSRIPIDIPRQRILFSANRYISNGKVPEITHIVYVDPQKYSELSEKKDIIAIGNAVGKLNQILPKRRFVLMGPGRWGSRGDIKLGVSVTYSDINNTSMLVEIARKQKDYVPDLSFGTHFFQDLVEASIRYLPLYPDDEGIRFNDDFFNNSVNTFPELIPELAHLAETIKVIDVRSETDGLVLKILMNAEDNSALGFLTDPTEHRELEKENLVMRVDQKPKDIHWRWRLRNIERLAEQIDPIRFGVKACYLFGSVKNATARVESDIDVLVHFQGTEEQKKELLTWFEGWSLALSQINYFRTGCKTNGLIDVHIVTDDDIHNREKYAVKIGAVTDAARPLVIGKKENSNHHGSSPGSFF
jgi:predicted nucleotidyltransferase